MVNHLANFIKSEREKRGLSLFDLAKLIGYKNTSKGVNRLHIFEREGILPKQIFHKIVDALNLDQNVIENLIRLEKEEIQKEFDKMVNTPVTMRLIIRYAPAIYAERKLPDHIDSEEEAIEYACDFAKERHLKLCLALSRKISIWIDENGVVVHRSIARPRKPNTPYMTVKRNRNRFLFSLEE